MATPCKAAERYFIDVSGSGVWSTASDWSPAGVPTAADDVVFNNASTYALGPGVTDMFTRNLTVTNGDVTLFGFGGGGFTDLTITETLTVAGFGTSPRLTVGSASWRGLAQANVINVGSGFGGTAELAIGVPGVLTAGTVTVGGGASSGRIVLDIVGADGSLPPESLVATDLTVGSASGTGVSGEFLSSTRSLGRYSADVTNHLLIDTTGRVAIDGFITASTATVKGAFDRGASSFDRARLEVANTLTWDTANTVATNEKLDAGTVQLASNLLLGNGSVRAGSLAGTGLVQFTGGAGILSLAGDLPIDGSVNARLGSSFSGSLSRRLFVAGTLSVGGNGGGMLTGASEVPVTSGAGAIGSGANSDGFTASTFFAGANGGWDLEGDLVLADDVSASLTVSQGSEVGAGVEGFDLFEGPTSIPTFNGSPNADIVIGDVGAGTHTVLVTNAGSRLSAADDIFIGGTKSGSGGSSQVTVTNGGELSAGDTITVWAGGTLDVSQNGTATFAALDVRGTADFGAQTLNPEMGGYAIAMNGGTLGAGVVDFGNLPLNGSGNVEAVFTTQTDVTAKGDLTLGDASDFNGVSIGGTLNVGPNTVTLRKAGFFTLGNANVATEPGSRVVADNGFQLPAGAAFFGQGNLQGRLASSTGSIISLTGGLAIGDATNPAGVFLDGELDIKANTITLNDSNDAVLGSLSTLGDGAGAAGVVIAQNGITLGFGRNLVGHGTVLTPNDPFKPFINNGNIIGDAPTNPITLTGYVKGVGTLDNVVITGTDAPGFSPATVYRGSVSYLGTLEIELGGTSPGSFDRVVHSATADIGGTLDLALINGFTPDLGDAFEIITAAAVVDTFDHVSGVSGPGLPSGAGLAVTYTSTSILVTAALLGDANLDGTVDLIDLSALASNFGATAGWAGGSFNGDNTVDLIDLSLLASNFGNTNTIPEPTAALILLALAATPTRPRHL
ncbi:beta strand repeat-containing protein [Mucisphaera sp.]|uniref:beta strand repeat-containing protein n=1 Tax=Mucisphaera sp. TaxID=2913024 RepID=UPI003D1177A6